MNFNFQSQEATSLYLALMLMFIFLAMSLAISTLLLGQLEQVKGLGDSVLALYAADTGIERTLCEGGGPGSSYSATLLNGASYSVNVVAPGSGCDAPNYCIKSVGSFKETKRAIEVRR